MKKSIDCRERKVIDGDNPKGDFKKRNLTKSYLHN